MILVAQGVVQEKVTSALKGALSGAREKGQLRMDVWPALTLDAPKRPEWGDLATTVAMALAASEQRAPYDIAQIIVDNLPARDQLFERVEIVRPGFLNMTVKPSVWVEVLRDIEDQASSDYLRHTGVTPVIVGGPADAEAVHRVGNYCAGVPIIQEQNLTTMAGILAGCRLFIGHDSGLTHLAGAMQISTIAIFGPTDPRQWAPLGAHVSVIAGPACSCPTWDQVRTCPSKPCLSISGSVIIEACRSMLSRYASVTKS